MDREELGFYFGALAYIIAVLVTTAILIMCEEQVL